MNKKTIVTIALGVLLILVMILMIYSFQILSSKMNFHNENYITMDVESKKEKTNLEDSDKDTKKENKDTQNEDTTK